MAEKDTTLRHDCDGDEDGSKEARWLSEFAAELAVADEIQIILVGDESQGKGDTKTDTPATCDGNLTRIKVMFKPCAGRMSDKTAIYEKKTWVERSTS